MHKVIDPAILYFGTPVVLVSTLNEDGSPNLAPMSSAWWLRYSCMLGFDASSKTPANLLRTGECVLNLASADMVDKVDLEIQVPPAFPDKYRDSLIRSAELCAVKKHLENPPKFDITTAKVEFA